MKVRTEPPQPRGGPHPHKHDWVAAAQKVRENPGLWVLAERDVSHGMVTRVRNGTVKPLHDLGGHVEAVIRDSGLVTTPRGTSRYGNLWLRWVPADWTDEDQRRAEERAQGGSSE